VVSLLVNEKPSSFGMKNTEVAEDLNISEQTVKKYLVEVYMKSRVNNKFDLISIILNFPENGNILKHQQFIRKTQSGLEICCLCDCR